jgi:metalloendopeptidase OMA1, mitochondrial
MIHKATGRLRFNIVSPHWEEQLAKKLHQEYLDNADYQALPQDAPEHIVARRVFDRMVPHSGLPQAEWNMTVYNHDDQMAFVLPGGKVFISTGMVNFCHTDDEVASIFGHEMAHHVCHHNAEGISRNLVYIPALLISWLVTGMDPDLVEIAVNVAYRLPGSRVTEREADQLGLLIMAASGYDASACFDVWSRWEDFDKTQSPSYLSTHPSHHDRSVSVYSWLNAARNKRLQKHHDGMLVDIKERGKYDLTVR